MTEPTPNDQDKYILSLVERLQQKYSLVSVNRMNKSVRFYYGFDTVKDMIEIPKTDLDRCMEENTIPEEIKKLL